MAHGKRNPGSAGRARTRAAMSPRPSTSFLWDQHSQRGAQLANPQVLLIHARRQREGRGDWHPSTAREKECASRSQHQGHRDENASLGSTAAVPRAHLLCQADAEGQRRVQLLALGLERPSAL